ncbi:hypothetical protein cypCar_00042296, partial [Cyprinus carpio]
MTGNCLKGSRPLLSFDPKCEKEPHHALLKELFTQVYFSIISPLLLNVFNTAVFSTPRSHPKSQPKR